jgi:LuxR family maltose regulon positive regulatory protein
MGTTATVEQTPALQRRRIIERPRLLALLDESTARVRTLVAPAGYGKTTLADQWVAKAGRRATWFTARRASADVAALAWGIAQASVEIVDGCDARLREHLRAVPAPAESVETLAELLAEDLEAWPEDSWLVVDEYQEVSRAADAERFIAALVAASPVQLLIASRQRPSWITTKGILYGEVLELNQTALAMDSREAAEGSCRTEPIIGFGSGRACKRLARSHRACKRVFRGDRR